MSYAAIGDRYHAVPTTRERSSYSTKSCGHSGHVGTCPSCQRAAQRRAAEQLVAAIAACEEWTRVH